MPAPIKHNMDRAARISWQEDGRTPRSTTFDDPYFAKEDGRGETAHVFLAGNNLPERWQNSQSFTIAELGFGSGLNCFETVAAWQRAPGACRKLRFVSFELFPMAASDIERALSSWPDLHPLVSQFLQTWPPCQETDRHEIALANVSIEIFLGDARLTLPRWSGMANAWYLDGFSPAKNPELWEPDLLGAVFEKTAPGGTFATYTVAGAVRRALSAAGFNCAKMPGFGLKRESLHGTRPHLSGDSGETPTAVPNGD